MPLVLCGPLRLLAVWAFSVSGSFCSLEPWPKLFLPHYYSFSFMLFVEASVFLNHIMGLQGNSNIILKFPVRKRTVCYLSTLLNQPILLFNFIVFMF